MATLLSTSDAAQLLGVPAWQVRRLYEDHTLGDPERVGRQRAIPRTDLQLIEEALRQRGWLPASEPAGAA